MQTLPADTRRLPPPPTTNWADTLAPAGEMYLTDPGTGMGIDTGMGYDPYNGCGVEYCPQPCDPSTWGISLDLLFLRPGNSEVTYAIEQTGCSASSVPTGQVGVVSPDIGGGFRLGLDYSRPSCGTVGIAYTWFESRGSSSISAAPGMALESLVTYPVGPVCSDNAVAASADQVLRFQFLDLDSRRTLYSDCDRQVYMLGGFRIARLDQSFAASQNIGVTTGLTSVNTSAIFDGFGLRLGIGSERRSSCTGLVLYAKGAGSLLGGKAKSSYLQSSQFGGSVPIGISREDFRMVPVLEAELGFGWVSRSQRWRLLGGYQASAWFNTLTTTEYIQGVRTGIYDSLGDTLTFDGLVVRIEYRR